RSVEAGGSQGIDPVRVAAEVRRRQATQGLGAVVAARRGAHAEPESRKLHAQLPPRHRPNQMNRGESCNSEHGERQIRGRQVLKRSRDVDAEGDQEQNRKAEHPAPPDAHDLTNARGSSGTKSDHDARLRATSSRSISAARMSALGMLDPMPRSSNQALTFGEYAQPLNARPQRRAQ